MGGTEIQNYYIAKSLINKEWQVHYIREKDSPKPGHIEFDEKITLHSIPRKWIYIKWLNIFHIIKIARRTKFSAWYIRGNISYVFPVLVCAKLYGGITIWNCSSDLQAEARKDALNDTGILWKPFALLNRLIYEKSLPYMDYRITQTKLQQKMLESNIGLSSRVLYNAHPGPEYSLADKQPDILFVANLKAVKQPHLFLELAERLGTSRYQFKMIGKPSHKSGLMGKISRLEKKNRNFNYIGELPIDKVNQLMASARLLICTSSQEGFSNVFIQAWLHGLPVISLSVDPDNLIKTHGLGSVTGDLKNTLLIVKEFMENMDRWRACSERCINFANNHFSLENAVEEIEGMARGGSSIK